MLPIYVISLPDSGARQKGIKAQAEILGLELMFFNAVDGRNGFSQAQEQCLDRNKAKQRHNRFLSDTELACAMSHALLCKKIAESDHRDGAIILEDDVMLSFDFAEILANQVFEHSQENLIIFYHSNCFVYPWSAAGAFKHYLLCKPVRAPYSTMGYYVSRKGAAEIYKNSWPISGIADWGFDIRKIGAKIFMPRLLGAADIAVLPSTIARKNNRIKALRFRLLLNLPWISYKFRRIFAVKIS